ncbi:MAG: peptidylglycine alpha-amidating monooxygenase [Deltaproteobacteria bacterium]|nr:peptidylglycine alpha-amidating monooxygenase [Deltaproteobacteria bacterium]
MRTARSASSPCRSLVVAAVAAASLALFAACSSDPEAAADLDRPPARTTESPSAPEADAGAPRSASTGLPCDVDAVLKARCQTCHGVEPKFGASSSLVTHDDLTKNGRVSAVKARIHDDRSPMPPSPNPRLGAKELATIDGWVAAGAKRSDEVCANAPPPDGVKPLSCKVDTQLRASKPFTMKPGGPVDQYVCFGAEMDLTKKRHVIGLAPKIDNTNIVHHVLLFQAPTAVSRDPFPCEAFGSGSWKLVAGWAPGGTNLELPPEAGFPANVGKTHWVIQMHYNTTKVQSGVDNSGYDLCTTETLRPNDAGVVAFGSMAFSIPPRSTRTIRCDYALPPSFANVKLFNASPHMHTHGSAISTERLRTGSPPETIFEQKAFSFEAQANFPISKSITTGDVMRTRCTWKNPTDATIGWGEGTGDEMCFDFMGYYPNIPDVTIGSLPIFTWVTPSLNALCVNE